MQGDFDNDRLFFDAVRDVVGADGIDSLRRDLGGSSISVPCVRLCETSPLAEALGMPAASAIVNKLRATWPQGEHRSPAEVPQTAAWYLLGSG